MNQARQRVQNILLLLLTLTISQPNYLDKVLKKFGMENCKPVSTPLEPGRKFQQLAPSDEPFDVQTYQQAIGPERHGSPHIGQERHSSPHIRH